MSVMSGKRSVSDQAVVSVVLGVVGCVVLGGLWWELLAPRYVLHVASLLILAGGVAGAALGVEAIRLSDKRWGTVGIVLCVVASLASLGWLAMMWCVLAHAD